MKPEFGSRQIHAFVDDELDLEARLAIETSLEQDGHLRAQVEGLRQLRQSVCDGASYHVAPGDLRSAIRHATSSQLERAERAEPAERGSSRFGGRWSWLTRRPALAMAAMVALVAIGTQFVLLPARQEGALANEVVASHVRSTLGEHLVDIASSDHHVVKPWLSSKLDFSPPMGDAMVGNASFIGGRLDYLDGRPVAALVYRAGGHVAEVYVWPDKTVAPSARFLQERGFQIAHWSHNGMAYWVVSDINHEAFASFVNAVAAAEGVR